MTEKEIDKMLEELKIELKEIKIELKEIDKMLEELKIELPEVEFDPDDDIELLLLDDLYETE